MNKTIKLNGKDYDFNSDLRLGVLEIMERKDLSVKHFRIILKDILSPTPNAKELFNIRQSQIERVMKAFGKFMEKESTEIKKKRF